MKAVVWYNTKAKKYEAIEVRAGRPFDMNATERKTNRIVGEGTSRPEALKDLLDKTGFVPFEAQAV